MNIPKPADVFFCLAIFTSMLQAQQGQSPMPALPPDIPRDATIWLQMIDQTPSGQDAVWTTPDGTVHEFYQFNDRGRGPKRIRHTGLIAGESLPPRRRRAFAQ